MARYAIPMAQYAIPLWHDMPYLWHSMPPNYIHLTILILTISITQISRYDIDANVTKEV